MDNEFIDKEIDKLEREFRKPKRRVFYALISHMADLSYKKIFMMVLSFWFFILSTLFLIFIIFILFSLF